MSNNIQAESVSVAGVRFAAAEVTLYGDANTFVPGCYLGIVSGSEGAQTFTEYVGGAGAVTAGVQRMTLASDDPAVVAVQIMDDWDESDRAKVNLIVGQAGIAAGAGAVGATVPRVTLASDDPAVALLTTIDADTGTLAVVGNGTAATAQRVTLASDSTGIVSLTTSTASIGKLAANSGVDIGDVDVTSVPADPFGVNADAASATGSISAKLRFIASTGIPITGTVTVGSHAVTNAGTFAVQAAQSGTWNITNVSGTVSLPTGAATAAKQPALGTAGTASTDVITVQGIASMTPLLVTAQASTNTQEVVGDAAHGAAVAGNPVLVGLEGRSTDPTAVDSGDVVRALASLLGKQVTLPYAIPASTWSYATATAGVTDTADDEAKAAGAAGVRHYITSVQVINGHATVATEVVIKDGATVLWRGWAEAVGGGVSAKFDPPLRGTAATAVNVANITTGSKTYFNLQGYSALE
jgi:hypothetical protein